jgi:anti-sigma factor RsiW
MTSHEARELFSAAYDSQLEASEQSEFDAALAADPELATEYAEFRELLQLASSQPAPAETPDLLAGVQHRLRVRSRGRFYRDRFAERSGLGGVSPLWVAFAIAVVFAALWIALYLAV